MGEAESHGVTQWWLVVSHYSLVATVTIKTNSGSNFYRARVNTATVG